MSLEPTLSASGIRQARLPERSFFPILTVCTKRQIGTLIPPRHGGGALVGCLSTFGTHIALQVAVLCACGCAQAKKMHCGHSDLNAKRHRAVAVQGEEPTIKRFNYYKRCTSRRSSRSGGSPSYRSLQRPTGRKTSGRWGVEGVAPSGMWGRPAKR